MFRRLRAFGARVFLNQLELLLARNGIDNSDAFEMHAFIQRLGDKSQKKRRWSSFQ